MAIRRSIFAMIAAIIRPQAIGCAVSRAPSTPQAPSFRIAGRTMTGPKGSPPSSILDEKMIPFRIPAGKMALALVLLVAALVSGCDNNIALIGRPTLESRGPPERVTATIDGVDHQQRELYLLAEGNQHYVVRYLSGTRVTAQGRDHPANSLRAGDRVEVELREGADRRPVTVAWALLAAETSGASASWRASQSS